MTTRRLFLAVAAAALVLTALWLAAHDHDPDHAARTITATAPETTTSSSATTTSTLPPTTTTTTTPPAPPTTVRRPAPVIVDAAFWARLGPGCESSTGTGGNGGGFFQFSPDTAKRVGYHAGLSYEEQRTLAVKWLGMIGGRGGSRAGWPVCWWRAGGR